MNLFLMIGIIVVIIIGLIILIGVSIYNKYQFAIVKISEAENNIDIFLQKKLDYFTRAVPILKEELKDGTEEFEKVLLLNSKKLNNFELNHSLDKVRHQFMEIIDLNTNLNKVVALVEIEADLEENEDDLEAAKHYYNDNVTRYNTLVKSFPSNLVGFIFHYKHKDFYSDEKEEMYQILKK